MTPRRAAERGPGTATKFRVDGRDFESAEDVIRYLVGSQSKKELIELVVAQATEAATAAAPLEHGDHVPAWKWCYFGLTIVKAEAQGVPGHRFCEGCARLSADEEGGTE